MHARPLPPKAPARRLAWIARYSGQAQREFGGSPLWIAAAVLAGLLVVVSLAIAIGRGGAGIFRSQSQQVESWALPAQP